jgi:hypothetical protein
MALNGNQNFYLDAAKELTGAQLAAAKRFIATNFSDAPNSGGPLTVALMQILCD